MVSALIMTIGTVAALRFELAVPLPKREQDAHSLVMLGFGSALATAVVGTEIVAVAGSWLVKVFKQPLLMPWLWVVPATASMLGVFLVLNQLAVRHGRYAAIGRRNLLQSVVSVLAQLLAGTAGLRPGGLVLGFGIGQTVGTLSLLAGSGLTSDEARAQYLQLRVIRG